MLLLCQNQLAIKSSYLKRILNIDTVKDNERLLKYYTGINNFKVFETICQHLSSIALDISIKALTLEECVLMVLVKVRRNLGFTMLAHLFGVSMPTIDRVFKEVTPLLARLMSAFIKAPSADTVARNLPKSLKAKQLFRKTRFIIDCTEVCIQRPTSLVARAQTYSNYKGRNTIKLLVACTPTGGVSFISKAWGGRVSDLELIRRSGFYNILEPGDQILADRGFPITEDLAGKGVTVLIQSFTRGKKQLEGRNVERSAAISRVRIHVERCISRMKTFKLLKGTIPITLMHQLDDFVTIIGGLCNLMPPLIDAKRVGTCLQRLSYLRSTLVNIPH